MAFISILIFLMIIVKCFHVAINLAYIYFHHPYHKSITNIGSYGLLIYFLYMDRITYILFSFVLVSIQVIYIYIILKHVWATENRLLNCVNGLSCHKQIAYMPEAKQEYKKIFQIDKCPFILNTSPLNYETIMTILTIVNYKIVYDMI